MNEHIKQAVEYAFDNKISDMQDEINNALLQKVADAISGKRIEVAQTMMSPPVSESDEDDFDGEGDDNDEDEDEDEKPKKKLKGKQKESDKDHDGDIDEKDLEKLRKEDYEDLLEKLSPDMGAEKYIHDFVNSDNPRFEGKSKKERIQMALGAYYSAKKGKTRNEEVEELDEGKRSDAKRKITNIVYSADSSIRRLSKERNDQPKYDRRDQKEKVRKAISSVDKKNLDNVIKSIKPYSD